jgi:hypothetical protein
MSSTCIYITALSVASALSVRAVIEWTLARNKISCF